MPVLNSTWTQQPKILCTSRDALLHHINTTNSSDQARGVVPRGLARRLWIGAGGLGDRPARGAGTLRRCVRRWNHRGVDLASSPPWPQWCLRHISTALWVAIHRLNRGQHIGPGRVALVVRVWCFHAGNPLNLAPRVAGLRRACWPRWPHLWLDGPCCVAVCGKFNSLRSASTDGQAVFGNGKSLAPKDF